MNTAISTDIGILAGGQALRMAGRDKGLQQYAGRAMVEQVMASLGPYGKRVLISANRNLGRYQALSPFVYTDQSKDFAGPLAGIYKLLSETEADYVLFCPCDTPNISSAYATRMLDCLDQLINGDFKLAIASTDGQLQPLHCLLPSALAQSALLALDNNKLSVNRWLHQYKVLSVDFSDLQAQFENYNHLSQLK